MVRDWRLDWRLGEVDTRTSSELGGAWFTGVSGHTELWSHPWCLKEHQLMCMTGAEHWEPRAQKLSLPKRRKSVQLWADLFLACAKQWGGTRHIHAIRNLQDIGLIRVVEMHV